MNLATFHVQLNRCRYGKLTSRVKHSTFFKQICNKQCLHDALIQRQWARASLTHLFSFGRPQPEFLKQISRSLKDLCRECPMSSPSPAGCHLACSRGPPHYPPNETIPSYFQPSRVLGFWVWTALSRSESASKCQRCCHATTKRLSITPECLGDGPTPSLSGK